ncbi:DUF2000 domain-containing protein [Curtobacterium sp. MCBD17_034]|uniref:DUF2000 domain-containing protein n=1 Tax=unclassified Curtobacterium TaxID=257496 RepID=UPI000DA74AE2|nr:MULTISPECIES: DUF2000 domain-containing protein [unclassified Curtobacterium]PZF62108.1 DUF2000 domain-containing protein [Curtobacterium sp. MCBD17_034]PZM33957.1 DUF2000 domain-containing protein [Curtobacterium sp. MCBD17_031]
MPDVAWTSRLAIVLREDLEPWQIANVTAFLAAGVAARHPALTGEPYTDGDGNSYASLLVEPTFVYEADGTKLTTIAGRGRRREVDLAIYPEAIFATNNDADNRATIADVPAEVIPLAGVAVYGEMREVDRVIKGAHRHR